MSEIVRATYDFLDTLSESDLIKNLTKYKNKLLNNKELLIKIDELKKETENDIIIAKRAPYTVSFCAASTAPIMFLSSNRL